VAEDRGGIAEHGGNSQYTGAMAAVVARIG
jgi:hypothetical protein